MQATVAEHFLVERAHPRLTPASTVAHSGGHHEFRQRAACALGHRTVDDRLDRLDLTVRNDRAECHLTGRGIARGQMRCLGDQFFGQRFGNLRIGENEAGGHADLALGKKAPPAEFGGGNIEIGVIEHDQRILAVRVRAAPS